MHQQSIRLKVDDTKGLKGLTVGDTVCLYIETTVKNVSLEKDYSDQMTLDQHMPGEMGSARRDKETEFVTLDIESTEVMETKHGESQEREMEEAKETNEQDSEEDEEESEGEEKGYIHPKDIESMSADDMEKVLPKRKQED